VDTAGPNPANWPVLKAYSLQVQSCESLTTDETLPRTRHAMHA